MKILVTLNGNFFVENSDLFGFFNKEGKLLRESNIKEFSWAGEKMLEYSGSEVNFDFSSLEERLRIKKELAIGKLISFVGSKVITQKILDYFEGNPEDLKISGQMPSDWVDSACSTGGCLYTHEEWTNAWGVLLSGEIVPINKITITLSAEQNANGSWSDSEGYTAEYLFKSTPEAKFFIVNSGLYYVTENINKNQIRDEDDWKIFKAPNMKPVLEARRQDAVSKIKDFLFGFKNSLNQQKIYETIKQTGVSDLDIVNMSVSEIGPEWSVEGCSTGGCAYSNRNEFFVWAVNNNNLVQISKIIMTEDAEQNANGSWSDSYGYDFIYLKKVVPQASFFIMCEEHERYADRQESKKSTTWWLLRPLTRKEIMVKKINSQCKIVALGDYMPELQALKEKMEA